MKTIVIIGGGASGLMAAITAAQDKTCRVLLLERQQRLGRKLLSTGNGRCNLTNTGAAEANYHGEDAAFVRPALEAFSSADTLAFFASLGLLTVEEYGGRVYPLSNSANSVLDVLRLAAARTGVEIHTACRVVSARREGGGFAVECENERFFADKLIVACGGAAGRKLGGVTDGYELLQSFGHSRTKLYPALMPLLTAPEYPRALKGVRADAAVTLQRGGEILARSEGEVQFTETGVSGPAVFDVSRAASVSGAGTEIVLDFFRGRREEELLGMLRARRRSMPELEAGELLCGMLHNRLGRMCVKYAGLGAAQPLRELSEAELVRLLSSCRRFTLEVRGTADFDASQVTAGGISTAEFEPETLQSRLVSGLYACGEVLDIDGDCGGYNLQWAWSSGALAGKLGSRRAAQENGSMLLVRNLRLAPGEDMEVLRLRAAKRLGLRPGEIRQYKLVHRSLDARKKDDIHYVCSLAVDCGERGEDILSRKKSAELCPYTEKEYFIPRIEAPALRPVVVGYGPAGMFAALLLARAGARPIVLERGEPVEARIASVERFRAGGALDPESNVQFGEGGAGTFSDGKLNTGTHDSRIGFVLRSFYEHGASQSVLYDAKPHIGTDVLTGVVRSMREELLARGGEIRFRHRLEELEIENGRVCGARVQSPEGSYRLPCEQLVLAIGHSARDTFAMLHALGVPMAQKPFSMGVRIEHPQALIDRAQYGRERGELPPADYSLSVHFPDGESAYTFCMCPGGQVFAAASEEGGVVTNGMSYSRRDGENANSALLVTLHPEDFPSDDVLAGMAWQRQIERAAFACGGGDYRAPAQLVGDFLAARPSTGARSVAPSYRPGVVWGELREVLPEKICSVLARALPELGKKLRGFDDPDAVLTAPETRSSSPVRILRGESFCSTAVAGLYPCGEGAGYAGGITSAAVDGLRCAEAVLRELQAKS